MWAFPGRLAVDFHPAASIPGTPCPVLPLRPDILRPLLAYRPFLPLRPQRCMHRFVAYLSIKHLSPSRRCYRIKIRANPDWTSCAGVCRIPIDGLRRACLICQCQDLDKVRLIYTRSREELNVPNSRGSVNGVRRTVTDISWTTRDSVTSEVQGACGLVLFLLSGMHSIYKFRSII